MEVLDGISRMLLPKCGGVCVSCSGGDGGMCDSCKSSVVAHVDHLLVGLARNLLVNLDLVAERQKSQQTPWIGGRQIIQTVLSACSYLGVLAEIDVAKKCVCSDILFVEALERKEGFGSALKKDATDCSRDKRERGFDTNLNSEKFEFLEQISSASRFIYTQDNTINLYIYNQLKMLRNKLRIHLSLNWDHI